MQLKEQLCGLSRSAGKRDQKPTNPVSVCCLGNPCKSLEKPLSPKIVELLQAILACKVAFGPVQQGIKADRASTAACQHLGVCKKRLETARSSDGTDDEFQMYLQNEPVECAIRQVTGECTLLE